MSNYEVSPRARVDLLQIWNYLAENVSFETADRVMADLEKAMQKIAANPGLGHRREDITDLPLLFYRVHSYLIAYAPKLTPIGIARVVHGARHLPDLF